MTPEVEGARTAELDRPVRPAVGPLGFTEDQLSQVSYDSAGLVAAVVQDARSKDVLMVGWMDREALVRTLTTGRTWFWSRSRKQYWCKGETSGDRQWVVDASYDCDGDAVLVLVDQEGRGACHTGDWSCFHRRFAAG